MNAISVINGVEVTDDGNITHFEPVGPEKPAEPAPAEKSAWQKVKDWFRRHDARPYAKIRDLSDPLNKRQDNLSDDGSGSAHGAEIGIKISF